MKLHHVIEAQQFDPATLAELFQVTEKMEGVVAEGGVLDQPVHSLEVECLAVSVPHSIRVNVSELKLGQALHIRDLVMLIRLNAPANPSVIAYILSVVGVVLALVTGWLGGELVERLGVGVDEGANLNAPSSLSGQSATETATGTPGERRMTR